MLKIRVIPTLLMKDVGLVKGVGFDSSRRVGSAVQAIKVYNMREVDELVLVDVSASRDGRSPDFEQIDDLADDCFMPMTVGGGVSSVEHVARMLQVGADKVLINTAGVIQPDLVQKSAERFGRQCIVVSIDVRRNLNGSCEVFTHAGTKGTGSDPIVMARELERQGAGELLLTSINRDGTMEGYDIDLIRSVAEATKIPIIASGGAGNYRHMADVLKIDGVSGVAAGSIYHFTEQTPRDAKIYLRDQGFKVRL